MIDLEALNCQEFVELVTDYLEGVLDERDHRAFEEHLDACDGCTEYIEQLRVTIELSGQITIDDLSPTAEDVLLQAFRSWERTS
jgi:predicted anti-sigma-YlaC factor YlaD